MCELKSEREEWIDAAKGIGICLVVLGHTKLPNLISAGIYSFHMPLFFYLSGAVYKNKGWALFFIRKVKSLLWPYFMFGIFSSVVLSMVSSRNESILGEIWKLFRFRGNINTPLWFLPSLFAAEIVFYFVMKLQKNSLKMVLAIIFFLISYTVFCVGHKMLPFCFEVSLAAVLYMNVGNLSYAKRWMYLIGPKFGLFLAIICAGAVMILAKSNPGGDMLIQAQHSVVSFVFSSFLGVTCVVLLSRWIVEFEILKKILLWCGSRSLGILCMHTIVMKVVRYFFDGLLPKGLLQLLIVCVLVSALQWIYSSRLRFLLRMR